MSSPVDLPDFVSVVGAPAPVLLGSAALAALPVTTAALPVGPWRSLELVVAARNNVTANNVITVTITWQDGASGLAVWVDTFTIWSSQTVGVTTADNRFVIPVRGTTAVINLASNGANDQASYSIFGTSREALDRGQANIAALSPHLQAVSGVATAASQIVNYRLGPVARRITTQLTAHVVTHNVTLFAQVPTVTGLVESQVAFASAVIGTPGTIPDLILPQLALRAQVQNGGGGAGTFDLVIVGDYQ